MARDTYFEKTYQAPFKGMNVSLPENIIGPEYSPFFNNFILKNGEIRTRPRLNYAIPGTSDKATPGVITSFADSNNVVHTVTVTRTGLWQLNPSWQTNRKKAWNLVGAFPAQPGPDLPVSHVTFLNKWYWTNGGNNLWMWDGIKSVGSTSPWPKSTLVTVNTRVVDSNGNVQICTKAGTTFTAAPVWSAVIGVTTTEATGVTWINNGKPIPANGFQGVAMVDATNGITAGGYFLGELGARLLMLNTVEGKGNFLASFPQRVRWSPSGISNIWDPNVNIGAGFNDEIDVPDSISGFLTIGRTGFIFRVNGVTEINLNNSGTNPFDFNHLWASDRGIGNVWPFTIAGYGPVGIFISTEEIYELSLGGFKKIGGPSRDAIMTDLFKSTSQPVASIIPTFQGDYIYPLYILTIPMGLDSIVWMYSLEDESWQRSFKTKGIFTSKFKYSSIS